MVINFQISIRRKENISCVSIQVSHPLKGAVYKDVGKFEVEMCAYIYSILQYIWWAQGKITLG